VSFAQVDFWLILCLFHLSCVHIFSVHIVLSFLPWLTCWSKIISSHGLPSLAFFNKLNTSIKNFLVSKTWSLLWFVWGIMFKSLKNHLEKLLDFHKSGSEIVAILTRSLPVYEYIEIGEKTGIFRLTYQPHRSLADCTRELFKPPKDSASLWVCNEKKCFGFQIFCEWHHK